MLRLSRSGNHPSGAFLENSYRGATFPYVSSNVVGTATGKPLLAPYTVKVVGGVPVGVVGVVLKETPPIVTPTRVACLTFRDEATAIVEQVATLEKLGVRTIVVTIHQAGGQPSFPGPTPEASAVSGVITEIVRNLDDPGRRRCVGSRAPIRQRARIERQRDAHPRDAGFRDEYGTRACIGRRSCSSNGRAPHDSP